MATTLLTYIELHIQCGYYKKLSYRKPIARQLRIYGIYGNSVTMKSRSVDVFSFFVPVLPVW